MKHPVYILYNYICTYVHAVQPETATPFWNSVITNAKIGANFTRTHQIASWNEKWLRIEFCTLHHVRYLCRYMFEIITCSAQLRLIRNIRDTRAYFFTRIIFSHLLRDSNISFQELRVTASFREKWCFERAHCTSTAPHSPFLFISFFFSFLFFILP